jgi:hypothetical protein
VIPESFTEREFRDAIDSGQRNLHAVMRNLKAEDGPLLDSLLQTLDMLDLYSMVVAASYSIELLLEVTGKTIEEWIAMEREAQWGPR